MPRQQTVKRIPSSEARANLALLLESVGEGRERILIERRGKAPVALVSVDDLLKFQLLEGLLVRQRSARQGGRGSRKAVKHGIR